MGVETSPNETHLPVQPSDSIPSETDESSDMPTSIDNINGLRGRVHFVPPCMKFAITSVIFLTLLVSLASANPLYAVMFAFLAVLPAGIVAKFIMTRLKDDAVSEKFLVNQFLIGAIPLSILVILVEILFGAILILMIFSQELAAIADVLEGGITTNGTIPANQTASANTTTTSGGSKPTPVRLDVGWKSMSQRMTAISKLPSFQLGAEGKTLPESMTEVAPLWKIILFLLLNAYLVAGLVEETGKWFVSRRYRKIDLECENVECGRTIGCRGILAVCSMGALGFATIENLGYVLGLSATDSKGFPFALVALALLRGVLAFPVHVGAQFYIGVAAAQKYIFNDRSRILYSLLLAIMLHGSFDAASLVVGLFISEKWWPDWTMAFVVAFQLFVVVLLMLLCRGRYKALLERERMVLPSQDDIQQYA